MLSTDIRYPFAEAVARSGGLSLVRRLLGDYPISSQPEGTKLAASPRCEATLRTSAGRVEELRRHFRGRRSRRVQRESLVLARRDEHRDLHVHAGLPLPAGRQRRGRRRAVPGRVGRDGRGDVLVRVLVALLLRLVARRRPDRRRRAGPVLPSSRPLLAARLHLWLVYVFFVLRFFPRVQTTPKG
jgi:hypothetical protein